MDKISNAIKCVNCLQILSSPVILPCGHSICRDHISTMESDTTVICLKCGQSHANTSFYVNEALSDMISARIDSLDFGVTHRRAKRSCNELSDLVAQMNVLLADPEYYIYEQINELKRQVDLRYEVCKQRLDVQVQRVLARLDEIENESKESLKSSMDSFVVQDVRDSTEKAQLELDRYFSTLNELTFDESKCRTIEETCKEKVKSFEEKLSVLKGFIFAYRFDLETIFMEFDSSPGSPKELE